MIINGTYLSMITVNLFLQKRDMPLLSPLGSTEKSGLAEEQFVTELSSDNKLTIALST